MDRIAVESSNLAAIGYDPEARVLEVEFKKGGVYQYAEVPTEEYEALMSAESKGKYLAAYIKPRYPCTRC